jgi:hypothetical protein
MQTLLTHPIRILAPGETPPIDQSVQNAIRYREFLYHIERFKHAHSDMFLAPYKGRLTVGHAWVPPETVPLSEYGAVTARYERAVFARAKLLWEANVQHFCIIGADRRAYRAACEAIDHMTMDEADHEELQYIGRRLSQEERSSIATGIWGKRAVDHVLHHFGAWPERMGVAS